RLEQVRRLAHLAAPTSPPHARACGLLPSLPRPTLAPQTALWGWRAGSSRAWHHQGLASILAVRCSITVPPWRCAVLPVCGHLQQALRLQAGHAQCLVELAWAGAYPGGSAPPDPCQPKRIVVRLVFYCRAVCCRAPGAGACSLP